VLFRRREGVQTLEEGALFGGAGLLAAGRTVIGAHTRIRGTLRAAGSLVVHGTLEGQAIIKGRLTVTAAGRVDAEVEAQSVALEGQGRGSLRADERIVLAAGASFDGDLSTPILLVHPGSILCGRTRVAGVVTASRTTLSH